MCDQDSMDDMLRYQLKEGMSRREFGALTVGASLIAMLPAVANAVDTTESEVEIKTPDGTCDAYFVHPSKGTAPGVLVWPDIFGLRPAFRAMGKRLAESGYSVLVINPFYRTKHAPTGAATDFGDQDKRAELFKLAGTLNATTHVTDAKTFVGWLDSQAPVNKKRKMGTTGYCMGGPPVFRTAATQAARIGAAATFHGGGLVTDKPDSPHLLIPQMKAQMLVCVAQNDDAKEPNSKTALKEAFEKAKLHNEVEVYQADHGWCPPDSGVYNKDLAEKAWGRLLATFKAGLA